MKPLAIVVCLVSVTLGGLAATQEGMPQQPKPTRDHEWLKKFVGHWATESRGSTGEGQPAAIVKGTIKAEMMGDFWLVNTMNANFNGTPFTGIHTIGYDVKKKLSLIHI